MEAVVKPVEEVNVAELMAKDGAEEAAKKIEELLTVDPEVSALMEVAETVEGAYAAVKKYINLKLEEFKVIFQKAVDYFKEGKEVLDDEVLSAVAGGFSWGDLWNKVKKPLMAVAVFASFVAGGAIIGADVAGPVGAVVGGVIGAVAGVVGAVVVMTNDKK